MIDNFYPPSDAPSAPQRARMWGAIRRTLPPRAHLFAVRDGRSFVYGVAASFVIYFAAVGAVATCRSMVRGGTPEAVRLDEAYRSAIRELEQVAAVRTAGVKEETPAASARIAQLHKIDAAIADLRAVTGDGDLSPLTQRRLRALYALKLQALQQLIENGEMEL